MRPRLLVCPGAEGHPAGSEAAGIARALHRSGRARDVVEACGPADATRIARCARDDGVECLVVVGGDATLHYVIQAYLSDEGAPIGGPDIALLPIGRRAGFSKNFRLSNDPEQTLQRICTVAARPIDLGIAVLPLAGAVPVHRAFVSTATASASGLTGPAVSASGAGLTGRAAGLVRRVVDRMAHYATPVIVRVDGCAQHAGPAVSVTIANGRYSTEGALIAPQADPADGVLDVIAVYDLARAQGISLAREICERTHPGCRGIGIAQGSKIEVTAARAGARLELGLDSRESGHLPVHVRVAKGALRLRG